MSAIAIATTTRYTCVEELRCQLAIKMVDEAHYNGIEVSIVDASSGDSIRRALSRKGAAVVDQLPSAKMGGAWRQALKLAACRQSEVFTLMQPEKHDLVESLPMLAQPIIEGAADIIIPSRTEAGFQSYPLLQMRAEQYGNETFRRLTGLVLDVWLGVRLMNHRALEYFLNYDGYYGDKWDAIFIPLLRAQKAGLRLLGIEIDYEHPPEQTKQEEQDSALGIRKRFEQLDNLVPALCADALALNLLK